MNNIISIFYNLQHQKWLIDPNQILRLIVFGYLFLLYIFAVFEKPVPRLIYAFRVSLLSWESACLCSSYPSYYQLESLKINETGYSMEDCRRNGEPISLLVFSQKLFPMKNDGLLYMRSHSKIYHIFQDIDWLPIPNILCHYKKYLKTLFLLFPKNDLYLFVYNQLASQTSGLICHPPAVHTRAGKLFGNYNMGIT